MRAELARVLAVQADRVRATALSQLERTREGAPAPRAELVRRTAQALADLAAGAEGHPRRPLPALALHGLGDQLAVTGADVLAHGDDAALAAALRLVLELRRGL
ncbi:hypothetical protein [Kineococcus sp. SYSU DK005]|uniref:hypothetical protein n=1 Tax=Kineococcus sp. SYSU DK005 TaxID=3383126 RepID=UPI003D7D6911